MQVVFIQLVPTPLLDWSEANDLMWIDNHGINGRIDCDIDVCAGVDTTDGTKLGVEVRYCNTVVLGVSEYGLVDHWNRRSPTARVEVGDRIVLVNSSKGIGNIHT